MSAGAEFPALLEGFFLEWLGGAMRASPHTVASYRDTFALFLQWASADWGVRPCDISLEDITRDAVSSFLSHLSDARGCSEKTVNCRLAAFKSFAAYASYKRPDRLEQLRSIRDLPQRKEHRKEVDYLTSEEVGWLLEASEGESNLMVLVLYNTGFRISELLGARVRDAMNVDGESLRIQVLGKGRKERTVPLWDDASNRLREHIRSESLSSDDFLFRGRAGTQLTRSGARHRIDAVYERACLAHPELKKKRVTPHTFRHSTAMAMLAAGVDTGTVAIWMGHEHINTTHKYVVSSMEIKEEALSKMRRAWKAHARKPYKASDDVIEFLRSL